MYAHDLDAEAKRKEARQQMRVDVLVKDAAVHVAQVEEATRAARYIGACICMYNMYISMFKI